MLQIYALLRVKFSSLKMCECKKNYKYQVWVTMMMFTIMMLEIVLIYLLKLADHEEKSNSHKVVSPLKP